MISADELTDERIRSLMAEVSPDESYDGHRIVALCREALGMPYSHLHGSTAAKSKRLIASYLNARAEAK